MLWRFFQRPQRVRVPPEAAGQKADHHKSTRVCPAAGAAVRASNRQKKAAVHPAPPAARRLQCRQGPQSPSVTGPCNTGSSTQTAMANSTRPSTTLIVSIQLPARGSHFAPPAPNISSGTPIPSPRTNRDNPPTRASPVLLRYVRAPASGAETQGDNSRTEPAPAKRSARQRARAPPPSDRQRTTPCQELQAGAAHTGHTGTVPSSTNSSATGT